MEFSFVATSLGLLGSFHCVGMCGPIAMALPVGSYNSFQRVLAALTYNAGRATTYGIFGWLIGFVGSGIYWAGFQQYFSIVLGVIIMTYILVPSRFKIQVEKLSLLQPFFNWLKQSLSALFKEKNFSSLYFIGSLNGFLPCGLVYTAMAGALATGTPIKGSLFMILFGLGTFPLMVFVNLTGGLVSTLWRNRIHKAVPVLVSILAMLLIMRGLNLGIPYISPKPTVELSTTNPMVCH